MTSIVIVTYNRKLLLEKCLNSIFNQKNPHPFEVIVVDNNSTDGSADFIERNFKQSVKLIRNKTRVSLLKAKQLGINECAGDIIAFTDDDCSVSENWLEEISSALADKDISGGITLPADITLPQWWNSSLNWMIGINARPGIKYLPLGSNIAFHKYVLDNLEKHKNNIPVSELLPYGEDNYRLQKSLAAGFSLRVNKKMLVFHHIPQKNLTFRYLIKRSYREGRCLVCYNNRIGDIAYNLFFIPVNLARFLLSLDLNYFFRIIVNTAYALNYLKSRKNNLFSLNILV